MPLSRLLFAAVTVSLALPQATTSDDPSPRPSFSEPSFSADRREIVFASGGDLWTVPASGGDARLLVSHPATERRPFFSPDGSRLAFTSARTGNGDIYVLTLSSGTLSRITFDDSNDLLDGWSRDGKYLYFSSTAHDVAGMNDVYRVPASGGTPLPVAGDRYSAEFWSSAAPDGRTIAITARSRANVDWWRNGSSHIDQSEIWLVGNVEPGATGIPRYSAVTGRGAKSEWPMWSRDGATLYYVSDRGGPQNLWTRPVSGGDERRLTNFTTGRVLWPAISLDGEAIVFERDFGIWVYDRASNAAKEVAINLRGAPAGNEIEHVTFTNNIRELALAPDGKKVAFVVRGEIYAASAKDGGDAARVTVNPASDGQVQWAPDSRRIVFASDRNGSSNLYVYDFGSRSETQLTSGAGNSDVTPHWSPDGKHIAYVRNATELHVIDPETKSDRKVATGILDRAPFLSERAIAWSPDSRLIAYLTTAGNKLFGNVFVVSAEGGQSRAVSYVPTTFSSTISWSPDGTYLLFDAGQRTEETQLIRVDLTPQTPRFREDQFRELFPQQPLRPVSPALRPVDTTRRAANQRTDSSRTADTATKKGAKRTDIVFEGIRQRSSTVPVGVDVNSQQLSPDGKYVLLTAGAEGVQNLYVYPMDELLRDERVARQLTSTSGGKSNAQWSSDGKEVWYLENNRINSVNVESRAVKSLGVSAEMDVDFEKEKMVVFEQGWRYLRDNFFDDKMNGVNWDAAKAHYGQYVAGARTPDEMRRAMQLMIGELNASHSGINAPGGAPFTTGRIGLEYDRSEYEKSGRLRVTNIIPLSPAALSGRIKVGDYLTAVEGRAVNGRTNVDELLTYRINRQTTLAMRGASGAYEVQILPANAGTEKRLIYREWVEGRRDYVSKISGGKLGYVHMLDMGAGSLTQLYQDLDAENSAKSGVVIDVRNNNGGFVNAYALDVFTRKPYLTMQVRGFPEVSARTQLGQRSLELPTVLVTNQMSLSDAEDFSEGYRALGLGKIVGEPTAGWIIYTSNVGLIDGSIVRLPFVRIRGADGKDMEMNPRPVDVEVRRPVGESYSGSDSQLDAAVRVLMGSLSKN